MNEAEDVRDELAQAREEMRHKEVAPIEGRVANEERYMESLLALQKRINSLAEEERRLVQGSCPCEGGDDCVC